MAYKPKQRDVVLAYLNCGQGYVDTGKKTKIFGAKVKKFEFRKCSYKKYKKDFRVFDEINAHDIPQLENIKPVFFEYWILFDKKQKVESLIIGMKNIYEKIGKIKYDNVDTFLDELVAKKRCYSKTQLFTQQPSIMVDLRDPNIPNTLHPQCFDYLNFIVRDAIYLVFNDSTLYPIKNVLQKENTRRYCSGAATHIENKYFDNKLIKIFTKLFLRKVCKKYKLYMHIQENINASYATKKTNDEWKSDLDRDFDFAEAVEQIYGKRIFSNGYSAELKVSVNTKEEYSQFVYVVNVSLENITDTEALGVPTEYTPKTTSDFMLYAKREINSIVKKSQKLISRSRYKIDIVIEPIVR